MCPCSYAELTNGWFSCVFDVDFRLDSDAIVKALQQDPYALAMIKQSAALSALVQTTDNTKDPATPEQNQQPLFLQALQATFPKTISKLEFVEYCLATLDMAIFKTVLVR